MLEKLNFQYLKGRLLPQDDLRSFRGKCNKVAYNGALHFARLITAVSFTVSEESY